MRREWRKVEKLVQSVFPKTRSEWKRIKGFEHTLRVKEDIGICCKPTHMSAVDRSKVEDIIKDMLSRGIIRPSNSAWCSPALLVNKKEEGKKRFCLNYRQLNTKLVMDNFPMPVVDDIL